MRKPNLNPRDRRALTLGGAVLGPALVWVLAVSPYLGALGQAREQLAQERGLLSRERELLATAADYPRVFDAGAERLLRAAPRLMGGDDDAAASAAVAGYVRRLAGIGGVSITRVEPGPSKDAGGGVTALPVAVTGEGDLEGLLTLLNLMEGGPKLVNVDELRMESSGGGAPQAAGAAYSATPFYTPTAAAAQPEVITFRFTATGYTLAQPGDSARAARGARADQEQDRERDPAPEGEG